MAIYLEAFILFVLCALLFPGEKLSAFAISCIILIFTLYCFGLLVHSFNKLYLLGLPVFVIGFLVPETCCFFPFYCYLFFYRKRYAFSFIYLIPFLFYHYRAPGNHFFFLIGTALLSFYFAYQSRIRDEQKETIHTLRDNSVEQEMILKKNNAKLIENQNNEIYIATLKERNRIAREIHDSVGHILSRSILQVGALLAICKESTLKPHLETLKVTLDEAMNSIRNSVHDLHDESIDLKTALTTLIEQFTFCPVQFECDLSKQIPKNVKYCFLSIVKEALNNIMKHSNAGKVCVLVKEHPAFYQLLIEDNGTNIAPSLHDRSGIGLSNMKEQVESMNGICNIDTKKGFRIFISVPKK